MDLRDRNSCDSRVAAAVARIRMPRQSTAVALTPAPAVAFAPVRKSSLLPGERAHEVGGEGGRATPCAPAGVMLRGAPHTWLCAGRSALQRAIDLALTFVPETRFVWTSELTRPYQFVSIEKYCDRGKVAKMYTRTVWVRPRAARCNTNVCRTL